MATQWGKIEIPLAVGLAQKGDVRAAQPSSLDIARDVQFEEEGGVQTRLPYVALSNQIFGGGALSNCRRLAVVNDELCVFTDESLYSWNAQLAKWVLRGTHLAVDIDERARFVTQGDQVNSDRAELNGTIMYAWTEGTGTYISAVDKTTGNVLMTQTLLGSGIVRPRLVAAQTRIIGLCISGTDMLYAIFDPANPAAASFTTLFSGVTGIYDVVRIEGQDGVIGAYQRTVTTSYTVFTVFSGNTLQSSTKARTADGPIALATTPGTGLQTQIVRGSSTNIQGDLLTTSTLADVTTGQAIGTAASTTINQITVSLASASLVRAFWTSGATGETTGVTDFEVKTNTVTGGVVGTQASFRQRLGIASRAFTYSGHVYVWLTFAQESGASVLQNTSTVRAQLQNTYFLYRDDNIVVSQCARQTGGGFNPSTGRLTGVAVVSGSTQFAWCPASRRRIDVGGSDHSSFESRSPIDVVFTFDSDAARRTATIGRTMYVSGGIPMQYDGVQIAEVGFLTYPWYFEPQVGGAGAIEAGTYTWKSTLRWPNAQGEIDRSTTATGASLAVAASKFVFLNHVYTNVTLKVSPRPIALDFWRTPKNVPEPMYRVNSVDPGALPGANNGYVTNDDTLGSSGIPLPDNYVDSTLITKQKDPETGDILEHLAPPGAALVIANDTRLILADVAGDPHSVVPSRQRPDDEVASFHDSLRTPVPRAGGDITALAFNSETLTVFRETAIYALPGDGPNNLGQGSNYGPARLIASDVGAVSQEAVALTPIGLVLKSLKGWNVLGPDWSVRYIGGAVIDFDSEAVMAVNVVETQHHVRILTASRMLIWDYLVNQWAEWTVSSGLHAVMWQGSHVVLTATGPLQQQTTFSGTTYGIDAETVWVKPDAQQGECLVKTLTALGEYRSAFLLRLRVARDYQYDGAGNPAYFDDVAWTPTPTTVGSALQVTHSPSISRCEAIKIRLTAVSEAVRATLVTTALSPQVSTSGTVWNSTWTATSVRPGVMGNALTMTIAFVPFVAPAEQFLPLELPFDFISETAAILVNDHYAWSSATSRWQEFQNNIGVVVAGSLTVAQLETIVSTFTTLATLTTPDATPSKVIDIAAMIVAGAVGASFSGGAYGTPTGEALKLTGLAAEVGVRRSVRRIPAGQKA